MTTSGTSEFNLELLELVEEAYERVGIEVRNGYDLRTARRSLDLLTKEWANRGLNLWTIKETEITVPALSPTVSFPPDTIDVLDAVWRTRDGEPGQNDRILTRLSVSEWSHVTNKTLTAQPTQYWVNRITPPVMYIWPLPVQEGKIVVWRMRRIEDAGNYTNTMDIPPRFLPAIVAGLAYYLALKTPSAMPRIPALQAEYERQFSLAADEDRERASLWLVPDLRVI